MLPRISGKTGACALLALSALTCSTDESFELGIDLRTDFNPAIEFDTALVFIDGQQVGARPMAPTDDVTTGVRIFEEPVAAGEHLISVRLRLGGAAIAERDYQLELLGDVGFIAVVSRSCAGLICGASETCIDGRCGSVSCITGAEPSCFGACTLDADCTPTACSQSRCSLGVCLAALDTSICQPWEFCDPDFGCETRPGAMPPVDGGPADAGPPDTGPADSGASDSGPPDTGAPDTGPPDTGPPDTGPPPPDPPTDGHLPAAQWQTVPVRLRGQCPPVSACGGDPQGIWDVSNGCLEVNAAQDDVPQCTVTYNLTGRARGRLRAGPTQMTQTLEWEISGSLNASCGVPCNFIEGPLEDGLRGALPSVSCNGCSCTASEGDSITDSGAYTNSGGQISVAPHTYMTCVSGDSMQVQRTDEDSTFVVGRQPLE